MKTKTKPVEMRRSWLVQRLQKPRQVFGMDNPFAFGGGLRNGGLSDDAMSLLRGIFSFDYMGSAEFEFGAVPEALSGLARDSDALTAGSLKIQLKTVPASHRAPKDDPEPTGETEVFYLARRQHESEVRKRIRDLAKKDYRLREATRFPAALRPWDKWDSETVGWLELDNGFAFFLDRDMWQATCSLFGMEVS